MAEERENEEEKGSGWGQDLGTVGEYLQIAFVFPLALVIGFFAGRWVGEWVGGAKVGAIAGLLLGTGAAFYNLVETLRRIQRREAERARERDG
jgi:F0F1-type ATP synthase assembly protein I